MGIELKEVRQHVRRRNNIYDRLFAKMATKIPIAPSLGRPFHVDSRLSHMIFFDLWDNIKCGTTDLRNSCDHLM